MGSTWLIITQAGATRRARLAPGQTRVGGGDAEVTVHGVGSDQLHVWDQPLRVVFAGTGAPPFCGGKPVVERLLGPDEWIEWAGIRLDFEREAALEELHSPPAAAPRAAEEEGGQHPIDHRTWRRVQAGLLIDLGAADKKAMKRWQETVVAGSFEVDVASEEIIRSARELDTVLLRDRAGRLMRDFLMEPLTRGLRGAGRAARQRVKGVFAMILSQGLALLVYSLIVLLSMLFLRIKGTSYDGFFDAILGFFGASPGVPGSP